MDKDTKPCLTGQFCGAAVAAVARWQLRIFSNDDCLLLSLSKSSYGFTVSSILQIALASEHICNQPKQLLTSTKCNSSGVTLTAERGECSRWFCSHTNE